MGAGARLRGRHVQRLARRGILTDDWQARVAAVWSSTGDHTDDEVIAQIDALVAERAADDPAALFEAASARDYVGRESEAEPLYKQALSAGLEPPLRGQAVIQLASTLRNLGRYDEAVSWLQDEFADAPGHPLADAGKAFMALVLSSKGDDTAALAMALEALSHHLPQYGNAVRGYAVDLLR
ncbi:MAG: tetratricopeptide repeat protein [Rhodoglobus sp.]